MVYQYRMVQSNTRRAATTAGIIALALMGAAMTPAAADDTDEISDDAWYALADDAADEIEATDWEAISAADGCVLVDVTVREVVDPQANTDAGAPEDLAVPVVEREEVCPSGTTTLTSDLAFGGDMQTNVSPGSDCNGTSGPGTICISRSGSYVATSWQYNGSVTVSAYLKLYDISTGASGCPTGDSLASSSTSSYSNGTRRSLTVYSPSYDGYSSYIWRYVGLGHYTAWGSACGIF